MRGLKKVRDKETGKEYTIDTFLSSQFLAMDKDGKAKFFFYKDRNVEWEEVK